ncbi:MAG: histidine--tRNA ligase [Clostridiales bacterium]|jgi:histidyl-tRNA synthetase|nr:histidine--tRNA ligase [Clostridiales bacterium]
MIRAVKGAKDLYGRDMAKWLKIENAARAVCAEFHVGEIRTPVFEYTELFSRSAGGTTDIVQKEMYTFTDKGGRSLTLKPEETAPAVRAFIERSLYADVLPRKFFYISPCFRYERPQAGRLRQFHQFGAEYYGSKNPEADAEVIELARTVLSRLGLDNVRLCINSLGRAERREKYNGVLKGFLKNNLDNLCPTCRERFEKNPLRALDCKNPDCGEIIKDAPSPIETLDKECLSHFETVKRCLDSVGVKYEVSPKMVRGLDYYTRTVFEFVSDDIGAQGSVCGGGRYDGLISGLGGPDMGAVGFAVGIERIMMSMPDDDEKDSVEFYVGSLGERGVYKAREIAAGLRARGFSAETDIMGRGVKAQLKHADRIGANYCVIIGENELITGSASVKNMKTGETSNLPLDEVFRIDDYPKKS